MINTSAFPTNFERLHRGLHLTDCFVCFSWHQDAAYITTYPETLVGCWLALEPADESNGCLLVADGSNKEPIYPERMSDGSERGNLIHAQGAFDDIQLVENTSHLDDFLNTLSHVAEQYCELQHKCQLVSIFSMKMHKEWRITPKR